MAKVLAGMTVSLDGFVADRDGSSDGLYSDLVALRDTPYMRQMIAETGAVLMGRRSFAMADDPDWYAGNYEFQVPIFVVTHHPPAKHPREDEHISFTFVTDGVDAAVTLAKRAAKDRDVTCIGGVDLIRQLLAAELVDELRIDVMPELLGAGLRLFEAAPAQHLELLDADRIGVRTTMRFAVAR